MLSLKNVDRLPGEVQARFIPLVNQLLQLHGENVEAVFVYGSAASPNFVPGRSDVNSVFVFRQLDFESLQKSLKVITAAKRHKIAAPLFLTKMYIESSLDVFPLEFLEMKESHVLLYGEDILGPLTIKGEYIRLFCEQQIKGKLLRVRQAYLEVGLKSVGIEMLLKDSLNSLLPIFRALLRLKGKSFPKLNDELLKEFCREFGLETHALRAIYEHKIGKQKIPSNELHKILNAYIDELRKLTVKIDQ